MQATIDPNGVAGWAIQHFGALGWPTLMYCAMRFVRFITKLEDRFLNGEAILIKMTSTDLPEMKKSLVSIDSGIQQLIINNSSRRLFQ